MQEEYQPDPDIGRPSWLTLPGHTRDSLWSIDPFRCKPILLRSHWVLVVMGQFTRRIIGFGVHVGDDVDGAALCRILNTATLSRDTQKYLSFDNDPPHTFLTSHDPMYIIVWRSDSTSVTGLKVLATFQAVTFLSRTLSHLFGRLVLNQLKTHAQSWFEPCKKNVL